MKVTFSGDVMTMSGSARPDHTYEIALTPTDDPKTIRVSTIETQGKAPKGSVLYGIYEIKGQQLKLCLPKDSSVPRPKTFEAPAGSQLSVLILVRQEDDDKPAAAPGR